MAATDETSRDQATLTDSSPKARERVIATGVIATSIAVFLLLAPFSRLAMPRTDAFIPAYEAALALVTAPSAVSEAPPAASNTTFVPSIRTCANRQLRGASPHNSNPIGLSWL